MKEQMPDSLAARAWVAFTAYFTPKRLLFNTLMVLYCLALFLGFDLLYSAFTIGQERERSARVYDPVYDHGFAANFDGYDIWGEARYREARGGRPLHITRFCNFVTWLRGDPSRDTALDIRYNACREGNCTDETCVAQGYAK